MKKILLFFAATAATCSFTYGKQISEATAKNVGARFLKGDMSELRLAYTAQSPDRTETYYYVFNKADGSGFIIVSGDDNVMPVLAYSNEEAFATENVPASVSAWLNVYQSQVAYAISHNMVATPVIQDQWDRYTTADHALYRTTTNSGTPLLDTKWNQNPYYNAQCPGTGSNQAVVGCVATAMAQIMKYWNYPATGNGSYSYTQSGYGTISANFGTTTYNWDVMPNAISSGTNTAGAEVAKLSFHCGVAVRMNYSASGSGSQVLAWNASSPSAQNAFKNYFRYKTTIQGLSRDSYADEQWLSLLKTEIDALRPVLYAGFGSAGGHAFVFDAYDDNDKFHINWGWGGMYNGYFSVDALNPGTGGTGSGTGEFNDNQQVLTHIEPNYANPMSPDQYEVNNAPGTAYSLPVTFVNNTAHIVTSGATFHTTNDKDYYQVVLPAGTNYTVTARLQDANSSNNGSTYTVDAKFSVSNNGTLFLGNYDSVMTTPASFTTGAGGTLYFFVQPKVAASMGSYALDITVKRDVPTGVSEAAAKNAISIYPNPANNTLFVNLNEAGNGAEKIEILNTQGQVVATSGKITTPEVQIPVQQLAAGLYFVRVATAKGIITEKVMITH